MSKEIVKKRPCFFLESGSQQLQLNIGQSKYIKVDMFHDKRNMAVGEFKVQYIYR